MHYDPLTKLPNRELFADRFAQAIARNNRVGNLLAICYLDLDGFKSVNQTYGHDAGDQFLIEAAGRIKSVLREVDTLTRVCADKFAMLIVDLKTQEQCEHLLTRIHQALTRPIQLGGMQTRAVASIGVTLYPLVKGDQDTLLDYSEQAMLRAKAEGRNCYRLFDLSHDQQIQNRYQKFSQIEEAFSKQQFCLNYQPKVNMISGAVFGVEALLRWNHPERGVLLPAEFLPIIEGTDLEIAIGDWVIREALKQLRAWHQEGLNIQVSVNVSFRHLQANNFIADLDAVLALYPEICSTQLELEVLESSVIEDLYSASKTLEECHRTLGVPFALDDFGTGYSSLTHMRHLSASTIKIDQSFVRHIVDNPDDLAIVEGIVGLSATFRRAVIAEGVETMEQGLILLNSNCFRAQGFGIARPMPGCDITSWIESYQPYTEWKTFGDSHLSSLQWQLTKLKNELDVWLNRFQPS
ncbi:MAG: putative bifunctional diguanylate cyclase/phosphodiesterase [Gammaproteobacteria bacterium]